jgi:hypothetical protein
VRVTLGMTQIEVDGSVQRGSYGGSYVVRAATDSACLASMYGAFYSQSFTLPIPGSPPAPSTSGPVEFVRADLVAGRFEGGMKGPPSQHPRKLKCTLGPK